MTTLLDAALRLAALGWFVFPCHNPLTKTGWSCSCEAWRRKHNPDFNCDSAGKHPRTQNGVDDATTDETQIREWWKHWPHANIGVNCGKSGLLVLDIDSYKDIYQGHDLELDEQTVTSLSGGGGTHLFYKQAGNLGNRRKGLPEGIDIRGEGGYVVVAPSLHKSGNTYQWEDGYSPWEMQPKPVPPKLAELLTPPVPRQTTVDTSKKYEAKGSAYGIQALTKECERVAFAANGTRNNVLNVAAFAVGQLVAGGELEQSYATDKLLEAAQQAGLSQEEAERTAESGLAAGLQNPRSSQVSEIDDIDAVFLIAECPDATALVFVNPYQRTSLYPYAVRDGVLKMIKRGDDDTGDMFQPIADFNAWITQEIIRENGKRLYMVQGQGLRGGAFEVEIEAETFGNANQLLAIMEAAAGALNKVFAGMSKHLGPAIKTLSVNVDIVQHYDRTGWNKDEFLFPGHLGEGKHIELYKQLRYGLRPDADLSIGLEALKSLMLSMPAEHTTVILAFLLSAPLYRKFGIGDRYGLFVAGKSGSLKTSFCQTAMSIYGEFTSDDTLIKWGAAGSTTNALAEICSKASDLPLLIDNYKPNTGHKEEFTKFIHMVMEGGTKARLTRSSTIKEYVAINTWPLITGEDVPQEDGATLARMLILYFRKQSGMNRMLNDAQNKAQHLCAIGSMWIRYIETNAMQFSRGRFDELRSEWIDKLQEIDNVLNPLRIANNLALNQLVWECAMQHPFLAPILAPLEKDYQAAVRILYRTMAAQTRESVEGAQWITIIRELVTAGKATLLISGSQQGDLYRQQMIGWRDEQGIYLMPKLVQIKIREMLGKDALNDMSIDTIYRHLDDAGLIVQKGKDTTTTTKRFEGRVERVLWLVPDALDVQEDEPEPSIAELGL